MGDLSKPVAKIIVDHGLCIGAASCISAVQGVFDLDEENKAVILLRGGMKRSEAGKEELEQSGVSDTDIIGAAQSCPVMAITLQDAEGNQIYP